MAYPRRRVNASTPNPMSVNAAVLGSGIAVAPA